ncbi:hypothetical protein ACFV00_22465, partial [Streptomyces californicus]|uniref:hypothetical protein n=1 Tax=Streptomyces californicus TaxID=67351 RepID=UPI0036770EB6
MVRTTSFESDAWGGRRTGGGAGERRGGAGGDALVRAAAARRRARARIHITEPTTPTTITETGGALDI